MASAFSDEADALKAIYGEALVLLSDGFRVDLPSNCEAVVFSPSRGLPKIIVRSSSSSGARVLPAPEVVASAQAAALEEVRRLNGEDSLFAAIQAAADIFTQETNSSGAGAAGAGGSGIPESTVPAPCCLVVHLDHMRDRKMYTKILNQWARQLSLHGAVFSPIVAKVSVNLYKDVLVVLEGGAQELREFGRRLRTQTVDVNAQGKPCKERMSSEALYVKRDGPVFSDGSRQGGLSLVEYQSDVMEVPSLLVSRFNDHQLSSEIRLYLEIYCTGVSSKK
jgi:hypothetical protein